MKKIFAILALAIAGTAFAADSFTFEGQHIDNVGAASQAQYVLGIKKELSGAFAGDVSIANAQTDGTNALSTRIEGGVTTGMPVGPVGFYTRAAYGQKYTNTTSFGYYSIEPGITAALGMGLTAKLGWRTRSAINSTDNNDQTHTMRYGVSYALSKEDTIGVRFDRVKGDSDQKVTAVSYTRSF